MYSPDKWEIVSEISSVACITAISLVLGRKLASIDGPLSYLRWLLLTLDGLSWGFGIIACMITSTNNGNFPSCLLGLLNCIVIYTATKVVLFLYFIEKIYLISAVKESRLRSTLYLTNLVLLVPYLGLIVLMVMFRVAQVADQFPFHCTIGYGLPASLPVLCYDVLITGFYTTMFTKTCIYPSVAQRASPQASTIQLLARRGIVASLTSLATSAITYCVVIGLDGKVRGVVVLSVATLDVAIVSCVVHWVAIHASEMQHAGWMRKYSNSEKPVKLEIKQHQEVVVLTEMNTK